MNFNIRSSNFEEILPYWQQELWPKRQSKIESFSAINIDGEIDMRIADLADPKFWVGISENKIVGVISCQNTDLNTFRLRGVWVDSCYRNKGIASGLTNTLKDYVSSQVKLKNLKNFQLWTMSREINIPFYERNGFTKKQLLDKYDYGPHWIMLSAINLLSEEN